MVYPPCYTAENFIDPQLILCHNVFALPADHYLELPKVFGPEHLTRVVLFHYSLEMVDNMKIDILITPDIVVVEDVVVRIFDTSVDSVTLAYEYGSTVFLSARNRVFVLDYMFVYSNS